MKGNSFEKRKKMPTKTKYVTKISFVCKNSVPFNLYET